MMPAPQDLSDEYTNLLDWYEKWSEKARRHVIENDLLLKATGSGKHLWVDETPDEYVNRLREGWG